MEKLIELQNIDMKLRDLNDLLGDLPSKVEELNSQEDNLKVSIVTNKKRLKEIELETNKLELKNSGFDEKIDKLKDQLFLVTNNKQYDALMNEIDHLKEEKSSFETDILNFLEEKESLKDSVTSTESAVVPFVPIVSESLPSAVVNPALKVISPVTYLTPILVTVLSATSCSA